MTSSSTVTEDFNLPSPERIVLLNSLQEAIGDVPPYFWALCQVCDLLALEKWIDIARISPAVVRILAAQAYTIALFWTQSAQGTSHNSTPDIARTKRDLGSSPAGSPLAKRQKIANSPSSSPVSECQTTTNSLASSPLLCRSKAATALARERDGHCCVLTNDSAIEVAHIYPFCQLSDLEEDIFGSRHMFWDHLKNFWSEDKVAAWEAELFPRGLSEAGDDRVDNRITLSKNAHLQWNRGAFALKPISVSDDNTTLKVQFFWQKKQPSVRATISLCTIPLSTEDLDRNEGAFDYGQTILVHKEFKHNKSGDIFDLKTNDPIKKPLPNFKLLELQWVLTRVIGMAGAAFPYESGSGDEFDEDVPSLDLDEVGDRSLISDIHQLDTQEPLYEVNKPLAESSKHGTEDPAGDSVGIPVIL